MRLTRPSGSAYAWRIGRGWTGDTAISAGIPGLAHSHGAPWRLAAAWRLQPSSGYGLWKAIIPSENMCSIAAYGGAGCECIVVGTSDIRVDMASRGVWLGRQRTPIEPVFENRFETFKHLQRSSRRNGSPVERREGPFVMRHEHVAGTVGERRARAPTSSRTTGVLHAPPEAFARLARVATMSGAEVEAHLALVGGAGRGELRRPRAPAPLDAPAPLWARCAADCPPWLALLPPLLGL